MIIQSEYTSIGRVSNPNSIQLDYNRKLMNIAKRYSQGDIFNLLNSVKCSNPVPSRLTALSKDHEPGPGLKTRPVASATDTPSTPLCKLLAYLLRPLLALVPAHVASTDEFLAAISQVHLQPGEHFGSLDVVNLYGSMPLSGQHNLFDVVGDFFEENKHATVLAELSRSDFIDLLHLSLMSDRINIDGSLYRQTSGIAMGNNLSPTLAIIYMGWVEAHVINPGEIRVWKRYIDDVFFVSRMSPQELLN